MKQILKSLAFWSIAFASRGVQGFATVGVSAIVNPRTIAGLHIAQRPRSHKIVSLRGGAITEGACLLTKSAKYVTFLGSSPNRLFNALLVLIMGTTMCVKIVDQLATKNNDKNKESDSSSTLIEGGQSGLLWRYLPVFWLLRCADWLQGPYFYEVYASKQFGGSPASLALISRLFLTGFASTALAGPLVGKWVDSAGRKKGTLAFAVLYTLGALSTRSNLLTVLLLGRLASGIGTSLLFSAPEAWLVGDAQRVRQEGSLGQIFGLASLQTYFNITPKPFRPLASHQLFLIFRPTPATL